MKLTYTQTLGKALILMILAFGCSKKKDPVPTLCYLTSAVGSGAYSYTETLVYNDKKQVVTITDSSPGSTTYIIVYTYDSNDNLATAVWSDGVTSTYTFDGDHRLILRIDVPGNDITAYTYTASGQHLTTTFTSPSCSDCGYVRTYSYPNTTTHNPSSMVFASVNPAVTYTYEYDDKPNPYKLVLYSSTGSDNNVTKRTTTISGSSSIKTFTYVYNDKGYPTQRTSSDGYIDTFSYDCD